MDVEETKNLILRRLGELQELQTRQRPRAPKRPPTGRAPERHRRSRVADWFSRDERLSTDLEVRLRMLEERLLAVERCFVETEAANRRTNNRLDRAPVSTADALPSPPPSPLPESLPRAQRPTKEAKRDTHEEQYRLTGSVDDGLMTDVLQLIAANRKTGRFSLLLETRKARFDLFYRDGEIIHAEAGELAGETAFFALMSAGHQEGRYGFIEGENDVPKTIEAQTHFMILEALRRIDEGDAGRDGRDKEEP